LKLSSHIDEYFHVHFTHKELSSWLTWLLPSLPVGINFPPYFLWRLPSERRKATIPPRSAQNGRNKSQVIMEYEFHFHVLGSPRLKTSWYPTAAVENHKKTQPALNCEINRWIDKSNQSWDILWRSLQIYSKWCRTVPSGSNVPISELITETHIAAVYVKSRIRAYKTRTARNIWFETYSLRIDEEYYFLYHVLTSPFRLIQP